MRASDNITIVLQQKREREKTLCLGANENKIVIGIKYTDVEAHDTRKLLYVYDSYVTNYKNLYTFW